MPVDERIARSLALEQAYVHDVYEEFYDNPRSKPWAKVEDFLNELEPGSIICDIGCGNGKYLNVNTSIFNIGGEKSNRLSEVAREKQNEVIVLDNLALPFRDESLDAVLSIAVVHHLSTNERRICALKELARVLRIGGRIIITVWAMEQSHRKFESQDVLVPWRRPRHISSPSLEITSTTTNSEDDGQPYHAYTQTSDSDSTRSMKSKGPSFHKRGKTRTTGYSTDPGRSSSQSSSSLSSPNETCYSFVRRAIQKLAGSRRAGAHRPWFLDSWTTCAKEPQAKKYDLNNCDCCDCLENAQDIPIELRRIDDEELPQRRQTFPSSQLINEIARLKSRSMANMKATEDAAASGAEDPSASTVDIGSQPTEEASQSPPKGTLKPKPKLVKQKKSMCEEDAEEALDQPTDMENLVRPPEMRTSLGRLKRGSVLKQRSLNEELMSTDRLQEKEKLRRNIQKQASLNEDLIYQRPHAFDNFKDSMLYVSTSKRFQLIKTGFTNKFKNSTTNIERVTGSSLKNGFVRIFQNWKSTDLISPTIPEDEPVENVKMPTAPSLDEKKDPDAERRPSKEDGSDSSKDSSLQSDTSVDSEDSFASVIFVPKSDPMSPTNFSPGPTSPRLKTSSVPNSPRIKQSSCPTSPRIKQTPLLVYPLTKQQSSPKPSTESLIDKSEGNHSIEVAVPNKEPGKMLVQKYSVPQIPKFTRTSLNTPSIKNTLASPEKPLAPTTAPPEVETRNERLQKIRELLNKKPELISSRKTKFPMVRQTSVTNGKVQAIGKPLPKLLTLELFNPETDDKDSDSSCVSSPDSVDSVISINSGRKSRFKFPAINDKRHTKMSLLEAAADVAQTLDEAVDKVIKSSPIGRKTKLKTGDVLSILQRRCSADTTPLLDDDSGENWDEDCAKHLTDFADKLSEKLLQEIDQYQVKTRLDNPADNFDDPYISRLSEELDDLSKLSAEIQKQNEYLAKLSDSDKLLGRKPAKCKPSECECVRTDDEVNNAKTSVVYGECSGHQRAENGEDSGISSSRPSGGSSEGELAVLLKPSPGSRPTIRLGTSTDSCDSEKGSSTNSVVSSAATSINFGPSIESNDGGSGESQKNTISSSMSRHSDAGSTASLASCPDWRAPRRADTPSKEGSALSLDSNSSRRRETRGLISDTSEDSDSVGGEITYHRFYHVFREGELDQLIEKYVENLHIISSYYDHASWCVIAEKVHVWTI